MNLRGGGDTNCDIPFRIRATKRNEIPAPDKSGGRQSFPLGPDQIGSAQRKHGGRMLNRLNTALLSALIFAFAMIASAPSRAETVLLNVSYDPTRELFREFDRAFAQKWRAETGEDIKILASHGGSGKQARAVIDGLEADVVTLALESDINAIVKKSGRIGADWRKRPAAQFNALRLDDCLCRAQGQSKARPRLAGPGCRRAWASSPPIPRHPAARAGIISPPGPGRTMSSAATRRGSRPLSPRFTKMSACLTPAPAPRRQPSHSGRSAMF